ncbi:HNH endonuclease [Bacillus thuringiensis]|nr:HNH endonuclease [Bacillus thuringiensis]
MSKRKTPPDDVLYDLYVNQKQTGEEIAQIYNVTRKNVYLALKKAGIEVRKPVGENHGAWKGGRVTCLSDGYVGIWNPDHPKANSVGYVREHTLVAEDMLGRPLEDWENVHHIDLDKHNNAPSNLYICSRKDHARCHRAIEKLVKPLMERGIIIFEDGAYKINN